jgi:hypothetical protein
MQPVSKHRIGKRDSTEIELLLEAVFSVQSVKSVYKEENCCNQFGLGLAGQCKRSKYSP